MKHYFDVDIAKECGINAAIIYENIKFWVQHNERSGKNFKEDKYWMYSTQKELSEQFEYLSIKQVRTALEKLETAGYIIKGNFNRNGYDRTAWYTITDKGQPEQPEAADEKATETPAETPAEIVTPKQPETPQKAPANRAKSKYPYGRKQKPVRANPEPVWLFGDGKKGATIQDIKNDIEKEKYKQKMRELAARCGAVCTV
ncbi:MAG: hypothetical protein IKA32_05230 [Lentisphaeria bacterium]|nr:hypothetical protein [Lentisphaeria bacterium]